MGKPARKGAAARAGRPASPDSKFEAFSKLPPLRRMELIGEFIAWRRLALTLFEALEHPDIRGSTHARHFLTSIAFHAAESVDQTSDESFRALMSAYQRELALVTKSDDLRRLDEARLWVRDRWADEAQAYENNKSAFARDYSRRLVHERGLNVGERTIRERWLRD